MIFEKNKFIFQLLLIGGIDQNVYAYFSVPSATNLKNQDFGFSF